MNYLRNGMVEYLGKHGPCFPWKIMRDLGEDSKSRVYSALNHKWFVNKDAGWDLSDEGKLEYARLTLTLLEWELG